MKPHRLVRTATLDIAVEESGPPDGPPVVLLHGFPFSPRGYDAVVPLLASAGLRVLVPFLRGYGPTRFLHAETLRSGQQGALGQDLLNLLDALGIESAVLGGYDWGGRAACVVAALWPERCAGLVTCTGYNIQNIPAAVHPVAPEQEARWWYQYYFHTERGRAGLAANRGPLAKLLWQQWSPDWRFSEAEFAASAAAFDNPDYVEVVIQSYRHRFGYAAGDPALEAIEAALATQPQITVPSINLHGATDGVGPLPATDTAAGHFSGRYERRVLPKVGHNPPQEAPEAFARAILDLAGLQ